MHLGFWCEFRSPLHEVHWDDLVRLPGPPPRIIVLLWGPLVRLPALTDFLAEVLAAVLVLDVGGPLEHEPPEGPVGVGPADAACLGEAEELHDGLLVELEDHEDLHPHGCGLLRDSALEEAPPFGEVPVEEPQEPAFEPLPASCIHDLEQA